MTYKLPDPYSTAFWTEDQSTSSIPLYTAEQMRTEIAVAERRGAEAMKARCAEAMEAQHTWLTSVAASILIRSIEL